MRKKQRSRDRGVEDRKCLRTSKGVAGMDGDVAVKEPCRKLCRFIGGGVRKDCLRARRVSFADHLTSPDWKACCAFTIPATTDVISLVSRLALSMLDLKKHTHAHGGSLKRLCFEFSPTPTRDTTLTLCGGDATREPILRSLHLPLSSDHKSRSREFSDRQTAQPRRTFFRPRECEMLCSCRCFKEGRRAKKAGSALPSWELRVAIITAV